MMNSFWDELEKLSAGEKPLGVFPIGLAAHEFGHAQNQELASHPGLKRMIERGVAVGGGVGEAVALLSKRPGMAALMSGVSNLPRLIEEGRASLRGYGALREGGDLTPEQLKKVRNQLLLAGGTYLGGALGEAGSAALLSHPNYPGGLVARMIIPRAIGNLIPAILDRPLKKGIPKSPMAEKAKIEALREQMGLETPIHSGSKMLEDSGIAAYVAPDSGSNIPLLRELRINAIRNLLQSKKDSDAKRVLREGGVIIRPLEERKKMDKVAKADEKQSRFGRIAKNVGLGLGAAGLASGIAYASLKPSQRKFVRTVFQRGGWKKAKQHLHDENIRDQFRRAAKTHGFDPEEEFKRWRDVHGRSERAWNQDFHSRRGRSGSSAPPPRPPKARTSAHVRTYGLGRVKTKDEVHKIHREQAKKYHPDLGGDAEKMKKVNSDFDDLKRSDWYEKLAMARHWAMLARALVK